MPRGGIDHSEQVGRGSMRFPRLFLSPGDRARFHFLADGSPGDPYFLSCRIHLVTEQGRQWPRQIACLDSLTEGEETCHLCQEGHSDMTSVFCVWTYVDFILHLGDNPDEEGERWEQVKSRDRIIFKETVDRPMIIWLKFGREAAWFGQFKHAFTKYGTLLDRIYELQRKGLKLDTDYTLRMVKQESLAPKKAKEATKQIVPIEEVFRSTAGISATPPRMAEGLEGEEETEEEQKVLPGAVPEVEEPEEGEEMV